MKIISPMHRTVSALTAAIFLFTAVLENGMLLAAPSGAEVSLPAPGISLQIPAEMGQVTEYHAAPVPAYPFIVHIQDAHANAEAQKNIQRLLEHFESEAGFLTVGLEGAFGPLHPEYLDFFSGFPGINERAVQKLLSQGELNGVDLFAWERYKKPSGSGKARIAGIEDPDLYRENVAAFRSLLSAGSEIEKTFRPVRDRIEAEASQTLPPPLRAFLSERRKRKEGDYGNQSVPSVSSPQLLAYVKYLTEQAAKELSIGFSHAFEQVRFPNLVRLLTLERLELEKDPAKASKEKENLLAALRARAGTPQERKLIDDFGNAANGPEARRLAEQVWSFASARGIALDGFPHFWKTFAILVLSSEIEARGLFREMKILEDWLVEHWARGEADRRLVRKINDIELLERLLRLKWTPEDHNAFEERQAEILAMPELQTGSLAAHVASAVDFYRTARRRDEAMLENLLNAVRPEDRAAVLVSGGFHTEGLKALMRARGLGYAVIQPRIDGPANADAYHKAMLGENTDLSHYFPEPVLTRQESLFFRTLVETAAPALWEEHQMPHAEIGEQIAGAINRHGVLSRILSARAVTEEDSSEVLIEGREENPFPESAGAPEFETRTVALEDALTGADAYNRLNPQAAAMYGEGARLVEDTRLSLRISPRRVTQISIRLSPGRSELRADYGGEEPDPAAAAYARLTPRKRRQLETLKQAVARLAGAGKTPNVKTILEEGNTGLSRDQIYGFNTVLLEDAGVSLRDPLKAIEETQKEETEALLRARVPLLRKALQSLLAENPLAEFGVKAVADRIRKQSGEEIRHDTLGKWIDQHREDPRVKELYAAIQAASRMPRLRAVLASLPEGVVTDQDLRKILGLKSSAWANWKANNQFSVETYLKEYPLSKEDRRAVRENMPRLYSYVNAIAKENLDDWKKTDAGTGAPVEPLVTSGLPLPQDAPRPVRAPRTPKKDLPEKKEEIPAGSPQEPVSEKTEVTLPEPVSETDETTAAPEPEIVSAAEETSSAAEAEEPVVEAADEPASVPEPLEEAPDEPAEIPAVQPQPVDEPSVQPEPDEPFYVDVPSGSPDVRPADEPVEEPSEEPLEPEDEPSTDKPGQAEAPVEAPAPVETPKPEPVRPAPPAPEFHAGTQDEYRELSAAIREFAEDEEAEFPKLYIMKDSGTTQILSVRSYEGNGGVSALVSSAMRVVRESVSAPFQWHRRRAMPNNLAEDRLYIYPAREGYPKPKEPQTKAEDPRKKRGQRFGRSELREFSRRDLLKGGVLGAAALYLPEGLLAQEVSGPVLSDPKDREPELTQNLERYRIRMVNAFSRYATAGGGAVRVTFSRKGKVYQPLVVLDRIDSNGTASVQYTQPLALGMWAHILALQLARRVPLSPGIRDPLTELEHFYQFLAAMHEEWGAPVWIKPDDRGRPALDRDILGIEDLVGYDGNLIAAIDVLAEAAANRRSARDKKRIRALMENLMALVDADDVLYERLYDEKTGTLFGDYSISGKGPPEKARHADRIKTNEIRAAAALRFAILIARGKLPDSVWDRVSFFVGPYKDRAGKEYTIVKTYHGGVFQFSYNNMYGIEKRYQDLVTLNENAGLMFVDQALRTKDKVHFPTAAYDRDHYEALAGLPEASEFKEVDAELAVPGVAYGFGTVSVLEYAAGVHPKMKISNDVLGGLLYESRRDAEMTKKHTAAITMPSLITLGRMKKPTLLRYFLENEDLHGVPALQEKIDDLYSPARLQMQTLEKQKVEKVIPARSELRKTLFPAAPGEAGTGPTLRRTEKALASFLSAGELSVEAAGTANFLEGIYPAAEEVSALTGMTEETALALIIAQVTGFRAEDRARSAEIRKLADGIFGGEIAEMLLGTHARPPVLQAPRVLDIAELRDEANRQAIQTALALHEEDAFLFYVTASEGENFSALRDEIENIEAGILAGLPEDGGRKRLSIRLSANRDPEALRREILKDVLSGSYGYLQPVVISHDDGEGFLQGFPEGIQNAAGHALARIRLDRELSLGEALLLLPAVPLGQKVVDMLTVLEQRGYSRESIHDMVSRFIQGYRQIVSAA